MKKDIIIVHLYMNSTGGLCTDRLKAHLINGYTITSVVAGGKDNRDFIYTLEKDIKEDKVDVNQLKLYYENKISHYKLRIKTERITHEEYKHLTEEILFYNNLLKKLNK